jgi:CheY-like chemotaxis protein/HPt (histidine-containing phosphotransfer) domain-containing protein
MLVFSISDTGQGMSPEQVNKLGDEYARFNMEANRKTEGTGLGMNITMNLTKLMKGYLKIDSTPGMGSTFTVHIPQKRDNLETIGKELAENLMQLNLSTVSRIRNVQVKRDFMPYGTVLVVDDVETNLYVARGLLAPYGLSIDMVMSGFEAVDKIREGTVYDIIFMDHMMPKMDGIEATKIIRSMGYDLPIVALTANALSGQADMFLNNGFDDFISKPIDIRQLNLSLNRFIRDKQPPEVIEAARLQKKNMTFGGSDAAISPQLAEFFINDARKAITVLETVYGNRGKGEDDISLFVINIHAMKSALANIGEAELSDNAARLEQAGRDQNIKFILSELPSFMELLYAVINRLEKKDSGVKTEKEENIEVDNEFLKEKLLQIRSACAEYNKKAAKDLLAELNEKKWPSPINEWFSAINGYLLHSDFEEAEKTVDTYLQSIQHLNT